MCWPRNWLHKDEEEGGLGDNILVLSISFDGNPGGAHDSVEEIGKNLLQSLVNKYACQTLNTPRSSMLPSYAHFAIPLLCSHHL